MKKNIFYVVLLAGSFMMASCESDRDANPILEHPTSFTLDQPEKAGEAVDLSNTDAVLLTCRQPAYGFAASAVYSVEVSLTNDFAEGKFETLPSTYSATRMEVPASELALATTKLLVADGKSEADFPLSSALYVRLKSVLSDTIGVVYSNPVQLNVRTQYALPSVKLPTKLYAIGAFCDWSWDKAPELVAVHSHPELFWRMVYLPEGGVKFNTQTNWNNAIGYDNVTIVDNNGAGVSRDNDGNLSVSKAGWYLLVVKVSVSGRDLKYEVRFNKPNVYLIGGAAGGVWEAKDENLFTVPATADADFVSKAMDATAEVRACVRLDGTDWWQTEFMVFDGTLEYRAAGGDQARVSCSAGQKLYINFTKGTGAIK